jgi:hypothetical protein
MNHVDWKSSFFAILLSGRAYSRFLVRRNKSAIKNCGEKPKRGACLCCISVSATLTYLLHGAESFLRS